MHQSKMMDVFSSPTCKFQNHSYLILCSQYLIIIVLRDHRIKRYLVKSIRTHLSLISS